MTRCHNCGHEVTRGERKHGLNACWSENCRCAMLRFHGGKTAAILRAGAARADTWVTNSVSQMLATVLNSMADEALVERTQ